MSEQTNQPVADTMYSSLVVELPSRGLLYPEDNVLSKGTVEIKYMTAKEEDILTTESYIKQGVVLDKLFQSLITTKGVRYDTMLLGDRNALMIAARIYGYGENYKTKITTPSGKEREIEVDLNELKAKDFDESMFIKGTNKFTFKTPLGGNIIEFKLLTIADETLINEREKKFKKPGQEDFKVTSRLFQQVISIDGNTDPVFIKSFIQNQMRALDSKAFRAFVKTVQPDINMEIELVDEETEEPFRTQVTPRLDFFWPEL